jgi:membrane dipeptidase
MNASTKSMDNRIARLHGLGIIDLHFDLPMFLYDHRNRENVLADDFLPEFKAGDIGTVAAGIYIEDQFVPERALEVALAQVARVYVETERCRRFAVCRSYGEIKRARGQG